MEGERRKASSCCGQRGHVEQEEQRTGAREGSAQQREGEGEVGHRGMDTG